MLHRLLLTLSLILLLATTLAQTLAPLDDTPRIAVISAFAPELNVLLAETDIEDTVILNGRTFTLGQLAGEDVVIFLSGISMVNAAMTTQLALDHFTVDAIIFSGIAGGVNPDLGIGTVTVPTQWAQYQEQFFARETEDGWDTGFYTEQYGHYEMMFPKDVEITSAGSEPDVAEERFWFPVDADMLAVAEAVAGDVTLGACTADEVCLDGVPSVVVGGSGVSGSTFVDNADYRAWVWETFAAQALDMETAAVAHVAYANDVPYIAFRSLSDLAGGGPDENEIFTFLQLAADNSAALVTAFLSAWADVMVVD